MFSSPVKFSDELPRPSRNIAAPKPRHAAQTVLQLKRELLVQKASVRLSDLLFFLNDLNGGESARYFVIRLLPEIAACAAHTTLGEALSFLVGLMRLEFKKPGILASSEASERVLKMLVQHVFNLVAFNKNNLSIRYIQRILLGISELITTGAPYLVDRDDSLPSWRELPLLDLASLFLAQYENLSFQSREDGKLLQLMLNFFSATVFSEKDLGWVSGEWRAENAPRVLAHVLVIANKAHPLSLAEYTAILNLCASNAVLLDQVPVGWVRGFFDKVRSNSAMFDGQGAFNLLRALSRMSVSPVLVHCDPILVARLTQRLLHNPSSNESYAASLLYLTRLLDFQKGRLLEELDAISVAKLFDYLSVYSPERLPAYINAFQLSENQAALKLCLDAVLKSFNQFLNLRPRVFPVGHTLVLNARLEAIVSMLQLCLDKDIMPVQHYCLELDKVTSGLVMSGLKVDWLTSCEITDLAEMTKAPEREVLASSCCESVSVVSPMRYFAPPPKEPAKPAVETFNEWAALRMGASTRST